MFEFQTVYKKALLIGISAVEIFRSFADFGWGERLGYCRTGIDGGSKPPPYERFISRRFIGIVGFQNRDEFGIFKRVNADGVLCVRLGV